jgi:hypothetical protein
VATDDELVDLPINQGSGEDTSSQGRDTASFVSENTRFLKKDTVATIPPMVTTWEGNYSDIRLLPTADDVYTLDAQEVNRLDAGGVVTNLSTALRPYSPEFLDVSLGRACLAWPQAVLCGDEVVVTWLEVVPEFGYLPFIAVLDKEGRTLQSPAQVTATGAPADMPVCPKYTLTKVDDDSVIIAFVSAPDANLSPPTTLVQVRYARSAGTTTFLTTSDVYTLASGGFQTAYVASCYDGVRMHHITYSAPEEQNDPWTDGITRYWLVGTDGVLQARTDLGSGLSASSFAALALHPTSGEIWMLYRGYNLGYAQLVDISAGAPSPTAINTSHPWFKAVNTLESTPEGLEPHELASWHLPRVEDGFVFFNAADAGYVVFQGAAGEVGGIDGRNLTGMSVVRIGDTVSAGSQPVTFPNLSFTGGFFEDADAMCIPAVERSGWSSLFIHSAGDEADAVEVSTPVEVWYRGRTVGGFPVPTQAAITNRPLFPPAYAVNCIASLDAVGSASVHTFHSMDEATDHTGLILGPEHSPNFTATEPARPANYKCTLGSVFVSGGEVYLLTSKQVGARLVGGDGSGGYDADDVRLEGWGCAINFLKLQRSKEPQSSFTTQRPVIGFDLVSVLSGNDILPTALPVPPIASVPSFTGTGAATRMREFKFLWCFIDEDGIRHRGPLSQQYIVRDTSVDIADDEGTFRVMVPGSFFSLPPNRIFLEVYSNPISDDAVEDTLVLTDTLPLPAPPFTTVAASTIEVPYSYNNTSPGLPFPYTDGGVLPNEARPTTGPITFNRQRVWSFDNKRLFFSKTEGYKKPFGFNSNLYFDSPDGSKFTGIASLDEQTVAFTRAGVYVNRGQLPNDLGAGGNTTLFQVTSPSGCKSYKSVVESPQGIFFQGERGLYLLQRNFEVAYIGYAVEDSLNDESILWSCYDKGNNEVLFATASRILVFNTLLGQWCSRHLGESFSHGAWHPLYGLMLAQGTDVLTESTIPTGVAVMSPLKHSTPWVSLNTKQGYQRCKRFLIQGTWDRSEVYVPAVLDGQEVVTPATTRVDTNMYVTFRVYVDHSETPAQETVVDLRLLSKSPLEIRIPNSVQKCRAVRLEIESQEANLDMSITSVVAVVGLKQGIDKRQITSGS